MSDNTLRLLMSAYACEPGEGSEPGVGWRWVALAAETHEVWVITRANNRARIEARLQSEPVERVHFIYYDLPGWMRFWKRGRRGIYLYYLLWQVGGYFVARRLLSEMTFDAAHHITLGTHWMPSFLSFLPLPYLWGPLGGGESVPPALWRSLGVSGAIVELIRKCAITLGEWNPLVRLTARRASLALAKTEDTAQRLRVLGARNVHVLSEAALTSEEIARLTALSVRLQRPFRVLTLARLIPFKAVRLGIRAFAEFHREHPGSEYWIVGDGWERASLEQLAVKL
jgi:glycosyltransferase involved in cell wall biosynthesis